MLSPAGGARNWGQTLHHELAHLFHGAEAGVALPTWLAEGLAETDTRRARAEWHREAESGLSLVLGAADGELFERLERSLTRPRSSAERGSAYFLAAEIVAFLERRHGDGAVRTLLERFRAGDSVDAALLAATGEARASLEAGFRSALGPRLRAEREHGLPSLSRPVDNQDDAQRAPSVRAAAALAEGRVDEARSLADAALRMQDDDGVALYVRARIAILERDLEAEPYLRRMIDSGVDAYEARVALARVALLRDETASATRDTEAALAAFPDRIHALDLCLRLAERGTRSMSHDRCARRLVDLDETASELALALLAQAVERRDFRTARILGERLVYVVPGQSAVHSALVSAYEALGMPDDARRARAMVRVLSTRAASSDLHR